MTIRKSFLWLLAVTGVSASGASEPRCCKPCSEMFAWVRQEADQILCVLQHTLVESCGKNGHWSVFHHLCVLLEEELWMMRQLYWRYRRRVSLKCPDTEEVEEAPPAMLISASSVGTVGMLTVIGAASCRASTLGYSRESRPKWEINERREK